MTNLNGYFTIIFTRIPAVQGRCMRSNSLKITMLRLPVSCRHPNTLTEVSYSSLCQTSHTMYTPWSVFFQLLVLHMHHSGLSVNHMERFVFDKKTKSMVRKQ